MKPALIDTNILSLFFRGQLDDIDLLIAGTAMANGLVLVTHNRRHFDRIPGLTVEDWAEA